MGWSVRTEGAQQLTELQARIKQAGDTGMNRKFRKEVREAGSGTVEKIRARLTTLRVTSATPPTRVRKGRHYGPRSSGLRARVARSVGISVTRRGIRIRASARKIGAYGITLPRYLDSTVGRFWRWRYPIFQESLRAAHHKRVGQLKGAAFFFIVIRADRGKYEAAVLAVMEQTKKELQR